MLFLCDSATSVIYTYLHSLSYMTLVRSHACFPHGFRPQASEVPVALRPGKHADRRPLVQPARRQGGGRYRGFFHPAVSYAAPAFPAPARQPAATEVAGGDRKSGV